MCHEILFLFFQPFKNVKIFLSSPAAQKQAVLWGGFGLIAIHFLPTTVLKGLGRVKCELRPEGRWLIGCLILMMKEDGDDFNPFSHLDPDIVFT